MWMVDVLNVGCVRGEYECGVKCVNCDKYCPDDDAWYSAWGCRDGWPLAGNMMHISMWMFVSGSYVFSLHVTCVCGVVMGSSGWGL